MGAAGQACLHPEPVGSSAPRGDAAAGSHRTIITALCCWGPRPQLHLPIPGYLISVWLSINVQANPTPNLRTKGRGPSRPIFLLGPLPLDPPLPLVPLRKQRYPNDPSQGMIWQSLPAGVQKKHLQAKPKAAASQVSRTKPGSLGRHARVSLAQDDRAYEGFLEMVKSVSSNSDEAERVGRKPGVVTRLPWLLRRSLQELS